MTQYKTLAVASSAVVSAAFNVPVDMKQAVVLIPDIDAGDVGIEVSMNAGTNYYPVINPDLTGVDAVVNTNASDPGWTDITKFIKAFAGKDFLVRFTCATQSSGAVDFHLFFIKGTKH